MAFKRRKFRGRPRRRSGRSSRRKRRIRSYTIPRGGIRI